MIYFGLIAVATSFWYFLSLFTECLKEKSEEYAAIRELLLHIRGALYSGGGRLCDITRSFKSDSLEKNGLLAVLCTDPVSCTGGACGGDNVFFRDKLSSVSFLINGEDAEKLKSYLASFGKSYLEEERKKLGEISEYFQKKEKDVSDKSRKSTKVMWTLFAFFFVCTFILVL